jgi:O-antigen/teichoic acid export membrane protein
MESTGAETLTPLAPAEVSRARGYSSTLAAQFLVFGLGALTGILSARMLGPFGRGEYAAIFVWPLTISYFVSFGLNQAITFHVARKNFTPFEVATSGIVIGLVQCLVSVGLGLLVLHFTLARYSPTVQHLGNLLALCTPAVILGGYAGNLFQGRQDLPRYNFLRVLPQAVYLAALLVLFLLHRGTLNSVIGSMIAGYVATFLVGIVMVFSNLRPRWQWKTPAAAGLLHYGSRTMATILSSQVNQRLDQLVLSVLVAPRQLGYYAVAVTLASTVNIFTMAAGIVTFSKGSSQQADDARQTIYHSIRVSLVSLAISGSILYAMTPFLIHLVFGAEYDGSVLACRIMVPGYAISGLSYVLYNGANALGRPALPSIAEGAGMLITGAGLYLLTPRYGYIGAAIVTSAAYSLSFLVILGLALSTLKLRLSGLYAVTRRANYEAS